MIDTFSAFVTANYSRILLDTEMNRKIMEMSIKIRHHSEALFMINRHIMGPLSVIKSLSKKRESKRKPALKGWGLVKSQVQQGSKDCSVEIITL